MPSERGASPPSNPQREGVIYFEYLNLNNRLTSLAEMSDLWIGRINPKWSASEASNK